MIRDAELMRRYVQYAPQLSKVMTAPDAGGLARLTVIGVDRCWLWTDTRREVVLRPSCVKIKTIQYPDRFLHVI
jgi:hypothetical protein